MERIDDRDPIPDERDDDPRDRRDDRDDDPAARGPTHPEDVPWYRRNSFCSGVCVAHVIVLVLGGCIPFASLLGIVTTLGVLAVCVIVLTGPVYYDKRRKDGTLRTWGAGNKVAAVILLVLFVGGYAALLYFLFANGRFG